MQSLLFVLSHVNVIQIDNVFFFFLHLKENSTNFTHRFLVISLELLSLSSVAVEDLFSRVI